MCALTWNACRCRAAVYRWRAWFTEATACRYQAASSKFLGDLGAGAGTAAPRRLPSAAAVPPPSGHLFGRPARQSAARGLEPAPHDLPDARGELREVRHRHDHALELSGLREVRERGRD